MGYSKMYYWIACFTNCMFLMARDWCILKAGEMNTCQPNLLTLILVFHCFCPFLPCVVWLFRVSVFGLIEWLHSHQPFHSQLILIIIIIVIIFYINDIYQSQKIYSPRKFRKNIKIFLELSSAFIEAQSISKGGKPYHDKR